jgi:hypothetical protein
MICQGSAHTMKGSSGSKGTKAVLPVVIDDIKKSHPGHIGAFFKPLHTKSKAGRRRKATTAGRKTPFLCALIVPMNKLETAAARVSRAPPPIIPW